MRNKRILTLVSLLLVSFLMVGCMLQNLPPKITSYPVTTVTVGEGYIYDVEATDPNTGDILTYSLTTEPPGMLINADNGVITWEADDITATGVGDYDVVVKVSDGGGLSDTQPFTIKVSKPSVPPVNQKPVIYSIPITTATVGETYFYNVYATDLDNDVLTYSLTAYPSSMTISSASGLIMWTPTAEGVYTVVVKVSDGDLSDTQGFTITVSKPWAPPAVNHFPKITSIPGDTAIVGVEYIYDVEATDPDGDTLTYSLITKPDGMVIEPGTGVISWTPIEVQVGVGNFTVKVTDGQLSDTQTFGIIVRELELGLIGIKVAPKTMTLFVGETDSIKSVTATYEFRGYETDIVLGDCEFMSSDLDVATVSNVGEIETIGKGTADILVSYKGKFDTVEVTVKVPVIDGVLSPGEWDGATEIPVADGMGTVWVLATTDYLYVAFDVLDSTDNRENVGSGNDQTSININPTDGGSWGKPCDIIFQTGADPDAFTSPEPDIDSDSSGMTDNWYTEWVIDGIQLFLPLDLVTKTIFYSGGNRVSEWKVPLASIAPSVGDILKVGGSIAIDVPPNLSFVYPIGLDPLWSDASTYEDITVLY